MDTEEGVGFVLHSAVFAILLTIRVVVVVEQQSLVYYHSEFPFQQMRYFFSLRHKPISPFSQHMDTQYTVCLLFSISFIGLRLC